MSPQPIPFNRPHLTGNETRFMAEAMASGKLAGDGPFTRRCREQLLGLIGCRESLLTHSCTAALEMCALLLELQPGDEVVMPSFTFVSTANAFALRGALPVFVDVQPDTQNIDPAAVEAAITPRTRAIVAVHYAGVGCDMAAIGAIAARHGLPVVPPSCRHNGHMYFVLLAPGIARDTVLKSLRERQISATFHYVPLHSSPAGQLLGRADGDLPVTDDAAARLVRLPLWPGLEPEDQLRVVDALVEAVSECPAHA